MLIQRVGRTEAEKIFMVCHNVEASTITTGFGARYVGGPDTEATSNDGHSVIKHVTGTAGDLNFAGIAAQDIPADGYGLIQAWGFVNSIAMSFEADKTVGTEDFATGGSVLVSGSLAGAWTSGRDIGTANSWLDNMTHQKHVTLWDTVNISSTAGPYGKGFVRAI